MRRILFSLIALLICAVSIAQTSIPSTTPVTQNFDGMAATLNMPANWRMQKNPAAVTWAAAATTVGVQVSSGSPTAGDTYNFGAGATDRSVGVMTSGSLNSPNSLMAYYRNTNASALTSLTVAYDLERYRINTAAASVQFFYSTDGSAWTAVTAGDIAAASLPTGTSAYSFAPSGTPSSTVAGVINKTGISITGLNIPTNGDIYLRWNLNTTGASSQGIAVDNVSVTAAFAVSSFRTITFTGASSDFNAGERFSAAANSTDYYMAFDATYLYLGAFRTSGTFGSDDNFAVYIDADPRSTPASGNGTTGGRLFNGVTPTLPFNADYTSYTTQTYTDPINRFNGSWATTGVTPTSSTNTTAREVRIALADLGNPSSIYVTMWMGYAGGLFSNAPGTNLAASATPTIAGYFGSFPVYKAGINPTTFRTQNTSAANGGGTPISDLTLAASGNIAGDYGDITISNASIGTVSIADASFTGSLTLSGTSTVALGTNRLNVGGRGIGGTAGRVVMNNTSATSIDGTSTAGTLQFLGAGLVNGSNTARTFGTNSTVAMRGGVDFTSSATTINGILQLNAGGFVNTNPPTYGSASTLIYNSGGTYTASSEWVTNLATGQGVPANVTIGNGVNTTLSFGTSALYRRANANLTIATGSTLALSTVSGGDLYLAGNYINNGTYTSNTRAIFMNGSSAQTMSGTTALAFPYLIINNSAGVSLSNAASITNPGTLTLTAGTLSLGTSNLTIASGATIASASSTSYIRTNSTGALIQTVGGTNVTYPVGNSSYNPLTISNSGTSDTHNVRVVDGALTGANDASYSINRRWEVTEGTTGGSVLTPALTYNSGEQNNATNWAAGLQNYVGLYNGTSWSQVAATQSGAGPFVVSASATLAPAVATYSFGLGRDAALGAAPPTISAISVAAPGTGTNGYVGATITVTGTGLASVTVVKVGGSAGTTVTIASQTSTTLTFTAINLSGQIYVENGAGNATSVATYTNLGYITNAAGVYTTAATWLGNAVPPASNNVTIAHAVTLASAANAAASMTINAASSFTISGAAGAITVNSITNNGTLASSAAGTITIAAAGTLTNNGTATMAAGAVVYAGAGTVNGTNATTFFNLTLNGGLTVTTVPTVNSNLTLNSGGFLSAALTYGATSTLIYNTTGTYAVSNEWTGNSLSAGSGIPFNVTIQVATTVNLPTTNRGIGGTLTITTGGVVFNGTSGDLFIGGNFVHNGSTFTTNGRAVFFNGAAAQAISGTGTISFDYLIINNSSVGGVTLNLNASIVATTGDVLQLLGTGPFNIGTANSVLTLSGNGGNVLVNGGTRTINLLLATNFIDFTGTKTVVSAGGGTLTIAGITAPSGARLSAGVNFGAGLTTIANNTYLTVLGGGFVNTNAVTYATGSTLSFNTGAAYAVGATDKTWAPGTSGAGVPHNVLVNLASTDVQINDNRSITNNLTITSGTLTNNSFTLNVGPSGGGNKVLSLNGGTLTNNGGTLNHNGNVNMTSGTFNMSSGTFMVDGNDGNSGTSVASGTDLFTLSSGVISTSVNGGTILINDPPFAGAGRAFAFTLALGNASWIGNTLQLGGSTGTNSSTATNGFNIDTYIGTSNMRLGNVLVNGGSGTSRFASASATVSNGTHIAGNLTINANSELRTLANGADVTLEGNLVNNGILTILSDAGGNTALNFSTRIGGTTSANSVAQTVSGSGTFQNLTASATAKFAELIINNTAGVTFNIGEVSVANTVTFTAGVLDIGSANDFVLVGTATQTRTTGYLNRDASAAGFMKRTQPGTGSHTYHIGNGGVYAPIVLNFTVNSVSRQIGVSVADATHPDMSNPITPTDYHTKYWKLFESAAGGNYTFTAAMTYNLAGDVVGTEGSVRVSGWDGTAWTEYGAGSVASPVITSAAITQVTAPALNNLVLAGRRNPTINYTWTGGANTTNWADAANWSPSGVPGSTDAVTIGTSATFNLNLTDSRTVNSLTLNGTGVMNIAATGSLTINGAVTYVNTATANLACGSTVTFASASSVNVPAWNYGNLVFATGARVWASGVTTNICGNLTTGSVAITATGSTVAFNGTAAQTISGSATFATLNITNTGGTVSSGSTLTINTALNVSANATLHNTAGTLTLASGSVNAINGTLRRTGSLTQSGATTTVSATGTYDHNSNGGAVLTATWSTGSTCLISGSAASGPSSGLDQSFHHLTWNCPGQSSSIGLSGAITTVNGNLSFLSTGSSGATLNLTGTTTYTLSVGGNLIINAANAINTKVNLTSSNGVATINLLGNFDLSDTGTGVAELSKSGPGAATINFRKVGVPLALAQQNYTQNGGAILNAIAFVVGGAGPTYSLVQLQTDAALGSNATMAVTSGSAIEFQTFVLTGPSFVLNNGGSLITANVNGITALGNASGSVQTTTTRTFNASCNFTYNGGAAQVTGSGLPSTANYLTIGNNAGVSLSNALTLNAPGGLLFNTGTLLLGANDLTLGAGVGVTNANATNYVVTNGVGRLGHTVGTSAASYTYPLGDVTGTAEYSPATLNFATNSVSRLVYLGVTDAVHPNNGVASDYLSRYWSSRVSTNTGTYSYTPTFTYVAADITGSEVNMQGNLWSGLDWTEPNATSTVGSSTLTFGTALNETTGSLATTSQWTARNGRCAGTPSTGTLVSSVPGPFCDNANTVLSLTGGSPTIGLTYQWQTSLTGAANSYSDYIGGTNSTFAASSSVSVYYRVMITCTNSSLSDTSAAYLVSIFTSPTIIVTPSTALSCGGSAVSLSASGGVSYVWSPNYNISALGVANVTVTPAVTTTYTVIGTDANGCTSQGSAVITASPAVPVFTVTTSAASICAGSAVSLGTTSINPVTVFAENFNGSLSAWSNVNNSTGGAAPATAAWTSRASGYLYSAIPVTFTTSDASGFYLSNSDEPGTGVTVETILTSPAFSLNGYTAASLSLNHYYRDNISVDTARVQISTNGSTWTNLASFTATTGTPSSFNNATISLTPYIGQSNVSIRFKYNAGYDYYWALNNLAITGTMDYTYNWSSSPAGLSSTLAAPSANVFANSTYSVTVTNSFGCTRAATSATVTRVLAAEVNAGLNNSSCGGGAYVFSGTSASNTIGLLWTTTGLGTFTGTTTLTPSYTPTAGEYTGNTTITFTLTGTANAPCANASDQTQITFNSLNNYYPDGDGDGYGNGGQLPTQACTAPVGYVANNDDQCDTDSDINPGTEWWYDADGDGIGGYIYDYGDVFSGCTYPDPDGAGPSAFIPYCPASNSGQSYTADCNDGDPNIFPGVELCNGIDDDCDGLVDEGLCAPINDNIEAAILVTGTNPISICTETQGTVLNASVSPESTSAVGAGGGKDVWYKFVAASPNVQIKVFNAVGFDPIIELRGGAINSTTLVDAENAGTGAFETMSITTLTAGQTYYYAVRSYGNTAGGTFKTCVGNYIASGCLASQSATISQCQTFKFISVGATNYTVTFTPTVGSVGGGTITTTTSFATSNVLVNLIPNSTYNVTIAANYSVTDAGGTTQIITLNSASPSCVVTVSPHSVLAVRTNQVCTAPATLLRSTFLRTDPFVCGVTNYSFEFTPVISCANNTSTGIPFVHTNISRIIPLNFTGTTTVPAGQTIQNQTYYQVRVRPNFGPGGIYQGTWGTPQIIYIGGSLMEGTEANAEVLMPASAEEMESEMLLYPNPNTGQSVYVSQSNLTEALTTVQVLDAMGRVVFDQQYTVSGTLQVELNFNKQLESGLYGVRIINGTEVRSQRMIVTKK